MNANESAVIWKQRGTLDRPTRRRRAALLVLVVASLGGAPVSCVMDGWTPSFVVYPLVLLVGLWRYRRGGGTLFFGIAATIFLLVHLPFAWAAITDSGKNPGNASSPYNPREWLVTMLAIPLMTAIAGFLAWREGRRQPPVPRSAEPRLDDQEGVPAPPP
jgi:hypothetical protein